MDQEHERNAGKTRSSCYMHRNVNVWVGWLVELEGKKARYPQDYIKYYGLKQKLNTIKIVWWIFGHV